MDKPTKNISKDTQDFNITVNQYDLTENLKAAEYTLFSRTQEKFSRMKHTLEHKTSLNKF